MQEPLQEPGKLKTQELRLCAASTGEFDPHPPTTPPTSTGLCGPFLFSAHTHTSLDEVRLGTDVCRMIRLHALAIHGQRGPVLRAAPTKTTQRGLEKELAEVVSKCGHRRRELDALLPPQADVHRGHRVAEIDRLDALAFE